MRHVDKNPLFGRTPKKISPDADWTPEPFPEFHIWYGIHEVYYNESDRGNPNALPYGWSANARELASETKEDLKAELELMLKAFEKPVLEYDMKPGDMEKNEQEDES
jgi:hypothetical protein